ncbi:MAG: hemerythrin domain-containing protein [Paracoccaceae bacterium]|nr:hemerythrin domain-containing protein [Paracoccaceae bacterium]
MNTTLSDTPLADLSLDEGSRPSAPKIPNLTDAQKGAGRHLKAIHRHHLREVSRARSVLQHIEQGDQDPSTLIEALKGMDLLDNMRVFGNLCGRECQMLNFHHDAEEQQVFPALEQAGPAGLFNVVAKLRAEHLVVHELIGRLETAAADLVQEPSEAQLQNTRQVFDILENVVRSHFSYEETEIGDAIGVYFGRF